MSPYVENKMQDCRRDLDNLRSQLGQEKYQYIKKLRELKLEEDKLRRQIDENRRKASREKDPAKKRALLLLIEEDGRKLEENLRKQQAIPKSGIDFNPSQHVSDLIDGIRRALQGNSNGGGRGGDKPKKPRKLTDDKD